MMYKNVDIYYFRHSLSPEARGYTIYKSWADAKKAIADFEKQGRYLSVIDLGLKNNRLMFYLEWIEDAYPQTAAYIVSSIEIDDLKEMYEEKEHRGVIKKYLIDLGLDKIDEKNKAWFMGMVLGDGSF